MPKRRRDNHIRRSYKRRRTFKRARRRTYKKKRRSSTLRIPRIFPDRAVVHHKYVCQGTLQTSFASPSVYLRFIANGMYDPEVAVGGHQPLLFDGKF